MQSTSAAPQQRHGHGCEQDSQVEPQAPLIDIGEVEAHPIGKIGKVAATTHLPQPGESGFHAQATAIVTLPAALAFAAVFGSVVQTAR